jgi:peptidoglycan/LPS O-acetylase OafA/YrhL
MTASLIKNEPITSKWIEIFFYDVTFVYNLFGPPQLAQFGHKMPLDGTGNHFWSICAEEQFYLLAPLLIISIPYGIGRSFLFWASIAIIALSSQYSGYFASISLGVLAAVSVRHADWTESLNVRLIALLLACVGVAFLIGNDSSYPLLSPFVAVATVVAFCIKGSVSPVGEILGGISYPLYLNQWIGGFAANAIFGRGTIAAKVSGVPFSLFVAAVLYFSVDRIVRRYRRYFYSERIGLSIGLASFTLVAVGLLGSTLF